MTEQTRATGGPVERAARAAARRLGSASSPRLETDVEAALQRRTTKPEPDQYLDPATLGSLIVSTATLAWTVFKDLRNKTLKPKADVVARRVRVELPPVDGISPAEQDRVIEFIVEEIINDSDE